MEKFLFCLYKFFTIITRILKSSQFTWILIIVIIILSGICFLTNNNINNFLFGLNTSKTKADLLTIYLGFIGGCSVIYGLYINNKKIEEQTRQNNIAEKNNNDKRFADAINYMDSEKPAIILSGIVILFQIASQDLHYRPIVARLFCDFLNTEKNQIRDKRIDETIFNYLLCSNIFKLNDIEFNFIHFDQLPKLYQPVEGFKNIIFKNSHINNIAFYEINNIQFYDCEIYDGIITDALHITLINNRIQRLGVNNRNIISKINIKRNNINNLTITTSKVCRSLNISENVINSSIIIQAPNILHKTTIENQGNIIFCYDKI